MEYQKELLDSGHLVCMDETCRFGRDALELASFVKVCKGDHICDLGAGSGILSVKLAEKAEAVMVDCVEKNPSAYEVLCQTVRENTLPLHPILADWNNLEPWIPAGSMDLVISNPPYFMENAGKNAASSQRREARLTADETAPLDVCMSAARLLKNGGLFYVCYRPERLTDLLTAMRQAGLEPKELRFLCHTKKEEPWLVLCKGKKGGKSGLAVSFSKGEMT